MGKLQVGPIFLLPTVEDAAAECHQDGNIEILQIMQQKPSAFH